MGQVDWTKLTSEDNLIKTCGYYLQHSKENLIVARNCLLNVSSRIPKRSFPSWMKARQSLPSAKPPEAQQLLERLFPQATNRLELYARQKNLRAGWKSIGVELQLPGLEALIVDANDLSCKYKTASKKEVSAQIASAYEESIHSHVDNSTFADKRWL